MLSVAEANKINEELKNINTIQGSSMDKFYFILNYYKDNYIQYGIHTYMSFFRQFNSAICEIRGINKNSFVLYTMGGKAIFCFLKEPTLEESEERICVVLHKPIDYNNNISIGNIYSCYHDSRGEISGELIVGINSNKTEYNKGGDVVMYGDCGCAINLISGKVEEGDIEKLCGKLDKKYLKMFT